MVVVLLVALLCEELAYELPAGFLIGGVVEDSEALAQVELAALAVAGGIAYQRDVFAEFSGLSLCVFSS